MKEMVGARMQLNRIVALSDAVSRSSGHVDIRLPRLTRAETKRWLASAGHPTPAKFAAVAAGTAAAAGAYALLRYWANHRSLTIFEFDPYELAFLHDLQDDDRALKTIQEALVAEWGPFGPADLAAMKRMARNAGRRIFVLQVRDGDLYEPVAVLQTARADVHGQPELLIEKFPTFSSIIADGAWEGADKMKGDTAILLQITSFGERGRGVGSLLRDAALYSLPASVKYALTTTPVDDTFDIEAPPDQYPAAVRFHYRGGARPAGFARGYKVAPEGAQHYGEGRQQNQNVVFMRYTRMANGDWEGVPPSSFRPRSRRARPEVALAPA